MNHHLLRVGEVLDLANSNNMTGRRKFLNQLDNLYANEEYIEAINIQTAKDCKSATSWNQIMLAVHRVALLEAERPIGKNSSGNSATIARNSCSSLMLKTVKLATDTTCISLSCDDLMAISFQIWKNKIYRLYCDTYISILVRYVLTNETYRLKITGEQWQEILRLSMEMYVESSNMFKSVLLDCMRLVIRYGCPQSRMLLDIKKMLPFIEKLFQDIGTREEFMLKQLYKLTYTVCLEIGTESRIALFKFSENCLSPVISLYGSPEMYEMMLLLVQIHHPGGVISTDDDAAYSPDDWNQWKNIIRRIYSIIISDIKTEKLELFFLKLCCEVYRQIFQDPMYLEEVSSSWTLMHDEHPRKVRRLTNAIEKPIDMLLMSNDLRANWPFIQILTVLFQKYPNTLKSKDYPAFLKIVTKFVGESLDNDAILGSLCELFTVLVEHEKEHYNEAEQAESVRVSWQQIWETVVRASSMNKNEVPCHVLLQSMIKHRGVSNSEAFLRLYLKRAFTWSSSSVETLLTFCSYTVIPSSIPLNPDKDSVAKPDSSIRSSLLQWALDIPSSKFSTEIPVVSLGKLLTVLATKSSYKPKCCPSENVNDHAKGQNVVAIESSSIESELFDDRESKAMSNIERCQLTLISRLNIFEDDIQESKGIDEKKMTTTQEIIVEEIFEALIDTLSESLANPLSDKSELNMRITRATVVAEVMSNFAELNVEFEGKQMSRLVSAFSDAYKNILSVFLTINNTALTWSSHLLEEQPIEALERLYRTRYHWKVEKIIVELSSMDFIKYINKLVVPVEKTERCKVKESRDPRSAYGDPCRIRDSAEKIFTYFYGSRDGEEMSACRLTVVNNFMKIDGCRCKRDGCIRRALRFLTAFGLSDRSTRSRDSSLDTTILFATKLLKFRGKDERAVRGVSKILSQLIRSTGETTSMLSLDSLVSILMKIKKLLANDNYGPLVHADFIECLAQVIRVKPLLKWRQMEESSQPIINHLISYIGNPFYVVRLEVARALYLAFSLKQLDVLWKLEFLEKVISALDNLFVTDVSSSIDEFATRVSTAVHILAAVIRGNDSRLLHCRALFAILELSIKREIKASTIKQALLLSSKKDDESSEDWPRRLIEMNLHKLLSHWLEAEYPLEKFPWILTDIDRYEDFTRKYIETLVTIKLQRLEFTHIEILCKNLEISFEQTIEDSFAPIMSLLASMRIRKSFSSRSEAAASLYARDIHERLRGNLGEFSNVKTFSDLLNEKLPQVVIDIIKRLHDQENFNEMFETDASLPNFVNQVNFNGNTVEQCLRLLEKDLCLEKDSLIEHLVTRRPSVLQKISLTLLSNIYEAKLTDSKLQEFYRYAYFYKSVIERLPNAYFDRMSLYVVRDVAHSLLGFIKEETALLSEMACSYFEKFLCVALPSRAKEMKNILSFAVSTLIPIVQGGKVKGAINVLHRLIVRERRVLAEAIAQLDSFPNEVVFEEIKQVHSGLKYGANRVCSLEKEIEHFLNAINEKTLSCNLESLSHLNNQLSTRNDELRDLYRKLERLRGFAEDCASSILHRLIYRLVRLARSSDTDIALEAAKCLGKIGPADLTTIILHPEKGYENERRQEHGNDGTDQAEIFTLNTINYLSEHLVDCDINVRRASADALYAVFSTNWAWKFTEKSALYDCVYPFVTRSANASTKRRCNVPISIDEKNLNFLMNRSNDLWMPKSYDTYTKWIIEITSRILDCFVNFYTKDLKPVCTRSVEFSEMILPRLVNLLINTKQSLVDELCTCINRFFGYIFESIGQIDESTTIVASDSTMESRIVNDISRSHECIRSMLNVVNFMRIHSIESNTPLTFDYLFIASAADYSSAYFTSLLYAELSCQALLRDSEFLRVKLPGNWISAIDSICEFNPRSGKLLQHIVREAYLHIGEPDSIYGCGLSHLIDSSFRAQHYTHRGQWDKVMLEQDIELNCSAGNSRREMLNALQQSGHQYLVGLATNSVNRGGENVDDFMYEAAWRLADWSVLEEDRITDSLECSFTISHTFETHDYHLWHYRALECLRDGNFVGLTNALINARTGIVESLRQTTFECSQTVYPLLSQLQMLQEIEDFAAERSEQDKYNRLIGEWNQQDLADTHDFRYVEPILSQRLAMYKIRKSGGNLDANTDVALIHTHLKIAEIAEKQGYLSAASRALDTLEEQMDLSDAALHRLAYQKALLAWKEEERNVSRYLLRNLIKKPSLDANLRAKALRICGNWMAETKCENPQAIIKNYYEESIKTSLELEISSSSNTKTLTDAQADLGQFADTQYQQIIRFINSTRYENLARCSKNEDSDQVTRNRTVFHENTDETEAIITYRQQVTDDASELEEIKREKDMYLVLAVKNYLITLENGNDHDLLVFRLVSLWLDNTFHVELNKILQASLPRIASYKFIALLCQVAPHMSNVLNDFTVKINDLMERCAKEHPHHTLPVLFALKNTYKDEEFTPSERVSRKNSKTQPEPRVIASDALISRLMHSEIRPIIQEISLLSHALVMLAYYKVPPAQAKKTGVLHSIPENQAITRIRDFYHTIVPTITLNVNPRGNYDNIVGIHEYEAKFELPGGVNAPKNVICVGTDGIQRRQLVKGQDDLRQDAVMQQVCTVVNSMLKASRETKRRRLHIRTYKIVPLSRRSGILEWCQNTLPISHILTDIGGKPGMHTKYYPNDWSVTECRTKLRAVEDKSRHVKLATFLECCKNLHPAFHHFFMEKYPSAETWFERRLAYVRSVATTSMVGYMLGLGDRHFSNILIDQTTAEVIHIDFGIAFAQGKVLPIPETVPFRLTRDMEVAMGISGVEGVMRRSCEETVAVLRDRRKTLITVLQVLLYDPLFSWAITPVKKKDLEVSNSRFTRGPSDDQDEKKTNEIAEKALLKIDEKLQGTADGLTLSISGQVERLIQQARDPANLCRLFCGWQPYL